MGRVIHFEITADDVARAVKFYQEVFGWSIADSGVPDAAYWLADTGEGAGIGGAIMPRADHGQAVVNTIEVSDVDDAVEKVKAAGGTVEGEIMPIPGVGRMVYFRDSEGNMGGLLESEKKE